MNISYNWLKQYINIDVTPDALSKALTSIGLEVGGVEEVQTVKGGLEGLVIGEVLTCGAHENSDHLHVTTVNVGAGEPLQIVCGAPNVAAGQKVVVATVGTKLYSGDESFSIKRSKIRGVESLGMLCAQDEIGIGTSHDGIIVLPADVQVGTLAKDYYGIKSDYLLEVDITPNRVDAASHFGVARDLAAFFALKDKSVQLTRPSVDAFAVQNTNLTIPVVVENTDACPRYSGVTISGVTVTESPEWLKNYLQIIGLRPINNIVDATNFVLHELGQPLHAFDADKIKGDEVRVKNMPEGTVFTTLDGIERKLNAADLMICNAENAMCIGGVFGGLDSGVTETTKNVFLESAYFNPTIVRKQSKRLGISSDSSYRFERGIDTSMQGWANEYACALIQEVAGGKILKGAVEYTGEDHPKELLQVKLRESRVQKVLGISPSAEEIRSLLTGIGLVETDNNLTFAIPPFRPDLEREVDLIEEVARLIGFDNIPYDVPNFKAQPNDLPAQETLNRRIRYASSAMGLHECLSLRFASKANIQKVFGEPNPLDRRSRPAPLLNPLSEELGVLPTSLIPNLLKSVAENEKSRPGSIRLFEVAKGQYPSETRINERDPGFDEVPLLCAVLAGHWKTKILEEKSLPVSFADLKGLVISFFKRIGLAVELRVPEKPETFLHPAQQAEIVCGKTVLGTAGCVHPAVLQAFDIDYETFLFEANLNLVETKLQSKVIFKPFSRQVSTTRDISMEMDEHKTHESVLAQIKGFNVKNLVSVELKSIYQGDKIAAGKKNMVYSFVYQSMDTTLTDEEVNKAHNKLREKMVQDGEIVLR